PNGVGELSLIRASWFMGFLMAILNSDETPSCSSFQLFCPVLRLYPREGRGSICTSRPILPNW
ncbi:hypothetical protein, partial [Moorena sp. SIO3I6]|uniref:hypothetical protein n=1 Tax=Moorena sp. SIO3I6 TaxID=2607831 RepID=UPI0025FF4AA3